MVIGPEDDMTTSIALYFEAEGRTLYMLDSRGRDTSALMAVDTETGETTEAGERFTGPTCLGTHSSTR